jgi:hypothetical protein
MWWPLTARIADPGGPLSGSAKTDSHRGKASAWVAVFLIVFAFLIGMFAMIFVNLILGIVAAVVLVVGCGLALKVNIMEEVH